MRRQVRTVLAAAAAAVLAGCSLIPTYERPAAPVAPDGSPAGTVVVVVVDVVVVVPPVVVLVEVVPPPVTVG
mgnify:CR=1 FL=1